MDDEKLYDVSVLTPDGWKTFTELLPCGWRFRRGQFFVGDGGYVQVKPRRGRLSAGIYVLRRAAAGLKASPRSPEFCSGASDYLFTKEK